MKYALAKFRVYLLGDRPFTVYTDHASLRTAVHSPHLSPRMARWLSFFAEYNFTVEYKPGRLNVVADALSRRPDYMATREEDVSVHAVTHVSVPTSPLLDEVRQASARDKDVSITIDYLSAPTAEVYRRIPAKYRCGIHRYKAEDGLLWYRAVDDDTYAVVVPDDHDLRLRIMFEYHDAPVSGHRGSEKTFLSLRRDFYWPHQQKFVRKYVRYCEVCQRAKSTQGLHAPMQPLQIPAECWQSLSMDFVFGLPPDPQGHDGILAFVDRFSKMVHLTAVAETISAPQTAQVFIETVFRLHGMPREIVSDRDPRFTSAFWQAVFQQLGTRLAMSTSDHPQTDGQTERTNRVLEEILRSYAHSFTHWSAQLSMVEFAINNSVHASTGHTPFFVNGLRHPRTPALLGPAPQCLPSTDRSLSLSGGGTRRPAAQNAAARSSSSSGLQTQTELRDDDLPSGSLTPDAASYDPSPAMDVSAADTFSPDVDMEESASEPLSQPIAPIAIVDGNDDATDSPVLTEPPEPRDTEEEQADPADPVVDDSGPPDPVAFEDVGRPAPSSLPPVHDRRKARAIERRVNDFVLMRQAINRFVQDAIADAGDRQKKQADKQGRTNTESFKEGDLVLLSTWNMPESIVSTQGSNKLMPKYIGPFRVLQVHGQAYTIDLPTRLRTHPTFYVGRLKPYRSQTSMSSEYPEDTSPSGNPRRTPISRRAHRDAGAPPPSLPDASGDPSCADAQRAIHAERHQERVCTEATRSSRCSRRAGLPARARGDLDQTQDRLPPEQRQPMTQPTTQSPPLGATASSEEKDIYPPPPPPLTDADGQRHWLVDRIVDHRDQTLGRHRQRTYRVHWRGYPASRDTWEPREMLMEDIPEDVLQYEQRHPLLERDAPGRRTIARSSERLLRRVPPAL